MLLLALRRSINFKVAEATAVHVICVRSFCTNFSVRSGQIHNVESARISMVGQLVRWLVGLLLLIYFTLTASVMVKGRKAVVQLCLLILILTCVQSSVLR